MLWSGAHPEKREGVAHVSQVPGQRSVPGLGQVAHVWTETVVSFVLGVLVGILWAYAPVGFLVVTWWLNRRARRKALHDILSRAAVLHD